MSVNPVIRQAGLTLIELMIAITISLIVLAALTAMFVTSSRARDEIARANQQIENGRYAMQVLGDDLRLAGYYSGHVVLGEATPGAIPDACFTAMPNATPNDTLEDALVIHVQGYDETIPAAPDSTCGAALTSRKANTDVLVIRRVSACVAGDTDCPDVGGELYFQASNCITEMDSPTKYKHRLSTNTFDRTGRDCATPADKRRFMTHVYYIAELDHDGDATTALVPTLMRAEMRDGDFDTKTPIAEGIEQLEFRYGIDYDGADGSPDVYVSDPGVYTAPAGQPGDGCPGDAQECAENWRNVMSVEVNLLARSTDPSPGHTDTKTYNLAGVNFTPGGNFKRHVFETTVRLNNPAGQRQQGG